MSPFNTPEAQLQCLEEDRMSSAQNSRHSSETHDDPFVEQQEHHRPVPWTIEAEQSWETTGNNDNVEGSMETECEVNGIAENPPQHNYPAFEDEIGDFQVYDEYGVDKRWMTGQELGEGLYPIGNKHGLSDISPSRDELYAGEVAQDNTVDSATGYILEDYQDGDAATGWFAPGELSPSVGEADLVVYEDGEESTVVLDRPSDIPLHFQRTPVDDETGGKLSFLISTESFSQTHKLTYLLYSRRTR